MAITAKGVYQLLPSISFLVWYTALMVFGLYAVNEDWSLKDSSCGQTTHLMKFSILNIAFAFFTCSSYLLFPGGGEGARARAVVITAFHFGFTVWGILMWTSLSSTCSSKLPQLYEAVYIFHHICVVHNVVFLTLMIIHELYLGEKLNNDFTLMAEFPPHGYARPTGSPQYMQGHPQYPQSPPLSSIAGEAQAQASYHPEIKTNAMPISPAEYGEVQSPGTHGTLATSTP